MIERDFSGKTQEIVFLNGIRGHVGNPSREEVILFMEKIFPPMRREYFEKIANHRDIAQKSLSEFRSAGEHALGKNLSRTALCCNFALSISDGFEDIAKQELVKGKLAEFRFWFDLSMGMSLALGDVGDGEDELSDSGDELRLNFIARLSDLGKQNNKWSASEQADFYLKMKRRGEKYLRMFIKDSSGFSIVDSRVEEIRKSVSEDVRSLCPEYVLAGAEFARDLYKMIYGIAAPLYSEQQRNK